MTSRFQIWICTPCRRERHYGFGTPGQPPAGIPQDYDTKQLQCDNCRTVTAHEFSRVVFDRDDHPHISWGDYANVRDPFRENRGYN